MAIPAIHEINVIAILNDRYLYIIINLFGFFMGKEKAGELNSGSKLHSLTPVKQKRASLHIAPLQPPTLATFLSWGIQQELVV